MKEKTQAFGVILILLIGVVSMMAIIMVGLDKQAKVDCMRLQAQESEYKDFYTTDYQKSMCERFGITFIK